MKTNKNIIIDFKLSRSFIVLAFLLNIFSFSGFAGNFLSKENKIIQTEVVISTLSKTKKSTVHYRSVFTNASGYSTFTISKEFILEFDRLTKIQLHNSSKQERRPAVSLFQNKLLPQKQTEDPSKFSIKG